jgi:hypothetical protein
MLVILIVGGLPVLGGCDPATQNTLINGIGNAANGLATALIQAWAQSASQQNQNNATPPNTIKARQFAPPIPALSDSAPSHSRLHFNDVSPGPTRDAPHLFSGCPRIFPCWRFPLAQATTRLNFVPPGSQDDHDGPEC